MKAAINIAIVASILFLPPMRAQAQHLWWDTLKLTGATSVYGEITVLATHHAIYYCGANWHPGEPAGGYCGIQHNSPSERRTIFSIWDTSAQLHPKVTAADPKTIFNRFGGEGEGAHTHMLWSWQPGEVFQFYVNKRAGAVPGTTDAHYYLYDRDGKKWRHSATITSPNGDAKSEASVATIGGGGLVSFLENFGGKDRDVPKLALYRLWLGTKPQDLKPLTRAQGDGNWGQLDDCYYLAEGSSQALDALFAQIQPKHGIPVRGRQRIKLDPISARPLKAELKKQLETLPQASAVTDR